MTDAAPHREHRMRSSLDGATGVRATSETELRALVRRARREGVIVFLPRDLAALPDLSRRLIESEHRRLCEQR